MPRIIEAEIPKLVEEKIDDILREVKRKEKELGKEEVTNQYSKPIYFKNYCISDRDLDYYDKTHLEEARKRITGRLRKLEELVYKDFNYYVYFYIYF